jgi:aminoglycoside phosphotransferase (APT) family kinase protein
MMRQQAKLLAGTQLPFVWQHHDFAPWNLFRSGDKLTVIDWEFNRSWDETRTGPPLCDLLYFLTYWSNLVHRHYDDRSELDGLYRLFIAVGDRTNNNQFIEASHRALAQYMSALAIESRFLPLLLVHTWMERVLYSHARARKLGRPSTTSRAAAKFASYVRLFATHAGQLFSTENDQYWQQQMRAASSSPANAPATEVLS